MANDETGTRLCPHCYSDKLEPLLEDVLGDFSDMPMWECRNCGAAIQQSDLHDLDEIPF